MDDATFLALALVCAPQIHPDTARAIARVESSFNPYAIGVVGGALQRQPRTRAEALATIEALQADGWNYSVGLGQINVGNFARLGLTPRTALDPCASLAAMQAVLGECYARAASAHAAQHALRFSLSCYYSGNFSTGLRHGYVRKVVRASASLPAAGSALPNRKERS
ncbi:lytic transglycosylase domain-containing protein [Aquabacterium sp. J223]|uniref:lytic transglycosylase domain-containing protein n=1 Tax=Aquabacterium sp. J223 TaxID=2898431 RepID=UPI0021ADEB5E|nr:lytic transglycosylase domain-containing protein [Aquabacterium sp. J223]UUX97305.1 lytic transglycosylase domain-containing protein [Aquabacterium sp. J223]